MIKKWHFYTYILRPYFINMHLSYFLRLFNLKNQHVKIILCLTIFLMTPLLYVSYYENLWSYDLIFIIENLLSHNCIIIALRTYYNVEHVSQLIFSRDLVNLCGNVTRNAPLYLKGWVFPVLLKIIFVRLDTLSAK